MPPLSVPRDDALGVGEALHRMRREQAPVDRLAALGHGLRVLLDLDRPQRHLGRRLGIAARLRAQHVGLADAVAQPRRARRLVAPDVAAQVDERLAADRPPRQRREEHPVAGASVVARAHEHLGAWRAAVEQVVDVAFAVGDGRQRGRRRQRLPRADEALDPAERLLVLDPARLAGVLAGSVRLACPELDVGDAERVPGLGVDGERGVKEEAETGVVSDDAEAGVAAAVAAEAPGVGVEVELGRVLDAEHVVDACALDRHPDQVGRVSSQSTFEGLVGERVVSEEPVVGGLLGGGRGDAADADAALIAEVREEGCGASVESCVVEGAGEVEHGPSACAKR